VHLLKTVFKTAVFGFLQWYSVKINSGLTAFHSGPYFNTLTLWSKAQGASAVVRACPNPLLLV